MSQKSKSEQEAIIAKGYRTMQDGWVKLNVSGTAYEMGFQHGFHLKSEIEEALRIANYTTEWNTGFNFEFFALKFKEVVFKSISDECMDELQGIVDGCAANGYDTTLAIIVAWNAMEEMLSNWLPNASTSTDGVINPFTKEGHCSAFMATGDTTETGEIVMAHNSWINYMNGMSLNVIVDYNPDNGNRMLLQTWAGHIDSGTDFFVTSSGIMGLETSISGFSSFNENGIPEFARARNAMQYANSVDDWMNILKTNSSGGYANTWMLGDTHSNKITQFDNGLKYSGATTKSTGYFGGFNVAENLKVRNQETTTAGNYYDISDEGSRRVRWMHFLSKQNPSGSFYGKVNTKNAKEMIGDHGDIFKGRVEGIPFMDNHPSSRTLCGHCEFDNGLLGTHGGAPPYYPSGANDGKVMDTSMAKNMSFDARWGHPCGTAFEADTFLKLNPQFEYMRGYLVDRPTNAWTTFKASK
jgi:hypothetical protein